MNELSTATASKKMPVRTYFINPKTVRLMRALRYYVLNPVSRSKSVIFRTIVMILKEQPTLLLGYMHLTAREVLCSVPKLHVLRQAGERIYRGLFGHWASMGVFRCSLGSARVIPTPLLEYHLARRLGPTMDTVSTVGFAIPLQKDGATVPIW